MTPSSDQHCAAAYVVDCRGKFPTAAYVTSSMGPWVGMPGVCGRRRCCGLARDLLMRWLRGAAV